MIKTDNNKNKIIIARIVLIFLILCWMNVIFDFSADTDVESQSLSDKITIKIVRIIKPNYDNLTTSEQIKIFDTASYLVRKTGHMCEYAMLGVLVSLLLYTFERIRKNTKWFGRLLLATYGIVILYAVSDELHQGFVKGRSPEVVDVLIDGIGGLLGALVVIGVIKIIRRIKIKREREIYD